MSWPRFGVNRVVIDREGGRLTAYRRVVSGERGDQVTPKESLPSTTGACSFSRGSEASETATGANSSCQRQAASRDDPTLHNRATVVRAFGIMDLDGPRGGCTTTARGWWAEILPKLRDFEPMTWAEIMRAAGGRTRGNNNQFVEIRKLSGPACGPSRRDPAGRRVRIVLAAVERDRAHLRYSGP